MVGNSRRRRTAAGVALCTTAAVVLGACGSSSSGSSSTSGSASSSGGGASGSPLKVMVEGALSGTNFALPMMQTGAKAAVDAVNAAGGVNGHMLVLETCDDASDPNKATACGNKAVSDKVVAVVGGLTLFAANILPQLQKANIPAIGLVAAPLDQSNPVSFPLLSTSVISYASGILAAKDGCKTLSILGPSDNPAQEPENAQISNGYLSVAGSGTSKPRVTSVSSSTPDYTSVVATALKGGADCIDLNLSTTGAIKAMTALEKSGETPGIYSNTAIFGAITDYSTYSKLAAKIHLVSNFNESSAASQNPQVAKFVAAIKATDPKQPPNTFAEIPYDAVEIFAAAAKAASTPDGPGVIAALKTLKIDTGLTPPLDFSKLPSAIPGASRLFLTSAVVYKVDGSSLTLDTAAGTVDTLSALTKG